MFCKQHASMFCKQTHTIQRLWRLSCKMQRVVHILSCQVGITYICMMAASSKWLQAYSSLQPL